MNKRLNITLPEQTVQLLDKVTKYGDRSELINRAVQAYIKQYSKEELRKQLKEAAIAMAEEDLKMAEEWFPIDQEAWNQIKD